MPIYYHHISGQLKTWLERTLPMVKGTNNPNFKISKELLEQAFQDGKSLIKP